MLPDVATIVLATAVLLVVVSFVQPLAARLHLPSTVLLALVGVAIGTAAGLLLAWPAVTTLDGVARPLAEPPVTAAMFLDIFLPVLVFQSALTMDLRRLAEDAVPILMLAVVAVFVTTGLIGWTVSSLSDIPLVVALLLGAIVATTDPSAVVAIFRDLGAPARLTRLVEGESLLNDAAAIAIFGILVGMLQPGATPDIGQGLVHFVVSFLGGMALGVAAARLAAWSLPLLRDDRASEMTLTLALPYMVFLVAEEFLHVSGVVAVVAAGVTFNGSGRARILPADWKFLNELWEQLAYWAGSLVFILAALLMPKLLIGIGQREVLLLGGVVGAALVGRILVLFGILGPLSAVKLSPKVSSRYMLVIAWGGLRGAVTVALALSVIEDPAIGDEVKRIVAILATGFVLFTLLFNGSTLRPVIRLLKLDRLTARDEALRDHVLALSLAEVRDKVGAAAIEYQVRESVADATIEAYTARVDAAAARRSHDEQLLERDRLAIALVGLASHERALVLEHHAQRTVSRPVVEELLRATDRMIDGARTAGRTGYLAGSKRTFRYGPGFRLAHWLHRRTPFQAPLSRRLADRFELLVAGRMLLDELERYNHQDLAPFLDERLVGITSDILEVRRSKLRRSLDALQAQYPEFAAALERRFLGQVALRQEALAYRRLYEDGLIGQELFENLIRAVRARRARTEERPRLDLSLKAGELIRRIDLFAGLAPEQAERLGRVARPLIAVPGEVLMRKGDRGDSVYFISSGAVEVLVPEGPITLGRGEIVGEMALLSGAPRRADVVAVTYSQLLVLYAADFRRFLAANPDARTAIETISIQRLEQSSARATAAL